VVRHDGIVSVLCAQRQRRGKPNRVSLHRPVSIEQGGVYVLPGPGQHQLANVVAPHTPVAVRDNQLRVAAGADAGADYDSGVVGE
jgi:hypothetical protein